MWKDGDTFIIKSENAPFCGESGWKHISSDKLYRVERIEFHDRFSPGYCVVRFIADDGSLGGINPAYIEHADRVPGDPNLPDWF